MYGLLLQQQSLGIRDISQVTHQLSKQQQLILIIYCHTAKITFMHYKYNMIVLNHTGYQVILRRLKLHH